MRREAFVKKKVLVVGLGVSGRAAAECLLMQGAIVHGVDRDSHLLTSHPEIQALCQLGLAVQAEQDCPVITTFDLILLSPGVPLHHPIAQAARQAHVPLIGEVELACQMVKNPLLGITGTNGKTTVTLLVTHILNQSKRKARAVGNVGTPFTRELCTLAPQERVVLELSSYQIETLYQPCLDAALILNITPDHLDRYVTMEAYAQAKCDIERCLKSEGSLYMEEKAWQSYGKLFKKKNPYLYGYSSSSFIYTDLSSVFCKGKKVFDLPCALKNRPSHDLENLLAAYALCTHQGVTDQEFLEAWKIFKKPAHRIEFIAEHRGVKYYDDSKGTNIDAVIRAVQALEGPIVLIAGGVDKGFTYTPWIEVFKPKVKLICAIGQSAAKIKEQLTLHIPVTIFHSLDEAVRQAAQAALPGETVLLSPGCSSFDMFKDYAQRGKEFQRMVHELALVHSN